jgi:hypothetical protein
MAGTQAAAQQVTPPPSGLPPHTAQDRPSFQSSQPARLQGFSVVLVVADLQASSTPDDVPPAARRALTDMKDFLPYKSYKLVDAAWILGQGTGGTSTRLRGPEEQDYELSLYTSRSEGSRVSVRFGLRDAGAGETASTEVATVVEWNRDRVALEREVQRLRERLNEASRDNNEALIKDLRAQLATAEENVRKSGLRRQQTKLTPRASRNIIDTSFTMDVGETVVVGTSRLKANSKALIALLTAVPLKGSKLSTEIR